MSAATGAQKILPKVGLVIRAKRTEKTVRVQVEKLKFDNHICRDYTYYDTFLAHDEKNACVEGDVVSVISGYRTTSTKRHIVTGILSAFQTGEPRIEPETEEEFLKRKQEEFLQKMKYKLEANPDKYIWKYKDRGGEIGELVKQKLEERKARLEKEKEEEMKLREEREKRREEKREKIKEMRKMEKAAREGEEVLDMVE